MDRMRRARRLLRLRERRERQAALQLALGLNEDSARRAALEEAEGQLRSAELRLQEELVGGLEANRLTLLRVYLDQRARGVGLRERLVADWQPRLEAQRASLREAARDRQALENWSARLLARQRLEDGRAERRAMDEIGLREALRRAGPEHGEM